MVCAPLKKAYTTTTKRNSFHERFWPQRKTFQAGGGYKNTISTTEIFPLCPLFFSARKSSALEQGGVCFLLPSRTENTTDSKFTIRSKFATAIVKHYGGHFETTIFKGKLSSKSVQIVKTTAVVKHYGIERRSIFSTEGSFVRISVLTYSNSVRGFL